MRLNVIRKNASSLRELGREPLELPAVSTLEELLTEMTVSEFRKRSESRGADHQDGSLDSAQESLSKEEIGKQAALGRVKFSDSYQENMGDMETAIRVMMQDFKDGLFRVYLNEKECLDLNEKLEIKDGDDVVLVRLVMLAGRMW